MALAADIAQGRAADPRIGDRLASLDVNGIGRIPVMEGFAVMAEEEAGKAIVLITEGALYQAIALRSRIKLAT